MPIYEGLSDGSVEKKPLVKAKSREEMIRALAVPVKSIKNAAALMKKNK